MLKHCMEANSLLKHVSYLNMLIAKRFLDIGKVSKQMDFAVKIADVEYPKNDGYKMIWIFEIVVATMPAQRML